MNEVNSDGPDFATQRDVWEYLVGGGKIRPFHWADAGYIHFGTEGAVVNHLNQVVNWTFHAPEEFVALPPTP
jgi:hypothetical protein